MGKITRLSGEAGTERLQLGELPGGEAPPRESVGQDLRNARLRRGDELSQVSHALRISKTYLEALESDCPDKLPGRTYAIGFVRTYANYLDLDAGSLVSRYKLATAGLAESAPQVGPAPEPGGSRWSLGWTLPAFAAAALLAYGFYELSRPPLPAPKSSGAGAQGAVAPAARPDISRLAARSSPPMAGAERPPTAGPAAIPAGQVFGGQNQSVRVILHAHGLAHVLVQGSRGRVYINRLLHPGDVYRVPNLVGLSLTTPNGSAVSLELDGQDMGAAGKAGHITEALSLDPWAIADRKGIDSVYEGNKVTP